MVIYNQKDGKKGKDIGVNATINNDIVSEFINYVGAYLESKIPL